MQTGEKTNDTQENVEKSGNTFCCGPEARRAMEDCCKSAVKANDCCSMTSRGMSACRWFLLIPVLAGVALLLVGYYVKPETTRVMWVFMGVALALFGVFGLLMAGKIKRICCP